MNCKETMRRFYVNIPVRACVWLVALSLLASCRSYRTLEIEVYHPADLTFPHYVHTLLIVNNAAQQPDIRLAIEGDNNRTIKASTDSAAHDLCLSLGRAVFDSRIFDDVRLCDEALRQDSAYGAVRMFSKEEAEGICRDYGADAFISLDRIVFDPQLKRVPYGYGYYPENVMGLTVSGDLHACFPDRGEVYAFPFRDSFLYYTDYVSPAAVNGVIRELSYGLGERLRTFFVPHWSAEERWYYTSYLSDWKRASAYAANGKWMEAEASWEALLAKTKNAKQQARLLSNLALCSELKGDFSRAVERAERSYQLCQSAVPDDEDPLVYWQKFYVAVLKNRLNNESALSEQLREIVVP